MQESTPVIQFLYRMVQDQRLAEQLAIGVLLEAGDEPRLQVFTRATSAALKALRAHRCGASEHRIGAALQKLSPTQRAAIILHKYHGMSGSDIAQILACSEQSVNRLLLRSYTSLRREAVPFLQSLTVPLETHSCLAPSNAP